MALAKIYNAVGRQRNLGLLVMVQNSLHNLQHDEGGNYMAETETENGGKLNIEKGFIPSEVQNNFCIRSIQYENYRKQYHKLIHN